MSPLFWPRLLLYGAICAALVGLGFGLGVKYYAPKLEAEKRAFAEFRGGVEALGRAAEKRARETDEANRKRKELADAQAVKAKRDLAGLYAAYRSLRDQRKGAGSGVLPAAAPGSSDPGRACFDRAALDRGLEAADGVLQSGAEKILFRGDTAINGLNTGREWAKKSP